MAQANALATELKRNGFAQVVVRHAAAQDSQPAAWHVTAEPLPKRHDQAAAIGRALAVWLDHMGSAPATRNWT